MELEKVFLIAHTSQTLAICFFYGDLSFFGGLEFVKNRMDSSGRTPQQSLISVHEKKNPNPSIFRGLICHQPSGLCWTVTYPLNSCYAFVMVL